MGNVFARMGWDLECAVVWKAPESAFAVWSGVGNRIGWHGDGIICFFCLPGLLGCGKSSARNGKKCRSFRPGDS